MNCSGNVNVFQQAGIGLAAAIDGATDYLGEEQLFNNGNINESGFFISVPNTQNQKNVIDDKGNFTYDYKYGRTEGTFRNTSSGRLSQKSLCRKTLPTGCRNRFLLHTN